PRHHSASARVRRVQHLPGPDAVPGGDLCAQVRVACGRAVAGGHPPKVGQLPRGEDLSDGQVAAAALAEVVPGTVVDDGGDRAGGGLSHGGSFYGWAWRPRPWRGGCPRPNPRHAGLRRAGRGGGRRQPRRTGAGSSRRAQMISPARLVTRAAQADPVAGSLSTPTAGAKNRAYRPAPSLGSLANRYRFGDQPSARPSFHAALSSPARSTRSA